MRGGEVVSNINDINQTDIWLDEYDQAAVYMERNGHTYNVNKVESINNGEEVCFFGRRLNRYGFTKQVYTICSVFGGDVEAKLNRLNTPEWLMNEIKGGK
jgi:hypothetical protein